MTATPSEDQLADDLGAFAALPGAPDGDVGRRDVAPPIWVMPFEKPE